MKNYSIFLFAMATMTLLVIGCNNEESGNAGSIKEIRVTSNIGSLSRVLTNNDSSQSFAKDDKISVYAWTGSADAVTTDGIVVNNSINTFDGSKWNANPQMLWKDMISAHFFLGIYPIRTVTNFAADPYTLDVTDQLKSDLLVAVNKGLNNTGLIATSASVPLTFDHVMSRLLVELSFRSQWASIPAIESVTVLTPTTATINYPAKVVTAGSVKAEAALSSLTIADAKKRLYGSILIPNAGTETVVKIKIAGEDYIYTGTVELKSGQYTTLKLIVGRDRIDLEDVSINNWAPGITIGDGEAQVD